MDADRIVDSLDEGGTRPSADCETFIKAWERCLLYPYRDSGNRWTIGFGHLMQQSDPRDQAITPDEADELFHGDLQMVADGIERLVPANLSQCRFDACCAFAFNVGLGNFAGSTLRKRINGGYFDDAADQFLVWSKYRDSSGAYVESKGLLKRRQAERAIFLNGDYSGRP